MINNKIIENELNDLEREISELLGRISELKKEVHELVETDSKILYEQYITNIKYSTKYKIQSRINEETKIINVICKRLMEYYDIDRYYYYDKDDVIYMTNKTKIIIETYIPSKNICLVVEL